MDAAFTHHKRRHWHQDFLAATSFLFDLSQLLQFNPTQGLQSNLTPTTYIVISIQVRASESYPIQYSGGST